MEEEEWGMRYEVRGGGIPLYLLSILHFPSSFLLGASLPLENERAPKSRTAACITAHWVVLPAPT